MVALRIGGKFSGAEGKMKQSIVNMTSVNYEMGWANSRLNKQKANKSTLQDGEEHLACTSKVNFTVDTLKVAKLKQLKIEKKLHTVRSRKTVSDLQKNLSLHDRKHHGWSINEIQCFVDPEIIEGATSGTKRKRI